MSWLRSSFSFSADFSSALASNGFSSRGQERQCSGTASTP